MRKAYKTFGANRRYKEPKSNRYTFYWAVIIVSLVITAVCLKLIWQQGQPEATPLLTPETNQLPSSTPQSQPDWAPIKLPTPQAKSQPSSSPEVSPTIELATEPKPIIDEAPEAAPLVAKTIKVKNGDNLSIIFDKLGLTPQTLHQLLAVKGLKQEFNRLKPGQLFEFKLDAANELQALDYQLTQTDKLVVTRTDNGFEHKRVHTPLDKKLVFRSGEIDSSLYLAGQKAGLSDKTIMGMAHIFGWDVDFILDIRPGDEFHLLYEELYKDGEKVRDGQILAAEFVNQGNSFKAVFYEDSKQNGNYYTPKGLSMRKAFLRAPVNFSRISSRFSLGRKHPILHKIRAHRGVDYAAPRGTPIKASGDGKVFFAGRKGGYGKTIILQHGQRYKTLYAHLNSYARGIKNGKRVKQGDVIGYVGSTGLASGPHLHYEFHVDGVHRNPLTVKLPQAKPIAAKEKKRFLQAAEHLLAELGQHKNRLLALNES